jgi:antitoxin component of RelBE/YafQ-DinJ toxin-antitoxin module
MEYTTLTIKTPKKLKAAAKRTADRLGIPLTTVVNAQLAGFVRDERLEVSLEPRPQEAKAWRALREEYRKNPERFASDDAESFIRSLRA